MIVTGESAGAHLALMVGLVGYRSEFSHSAGIRAVVNFYGIADVVALAAQSRSGQFVRDWLPESNPQLAVRMSPLDRLENAPPPLITIHGTKDEIVPIAQSERLTEAVRKAGGKAELVRLAGAGHGLSEEQLATAYRAVFAFLAREQLLAK